MPKVPEWNLQPLKSIYNPTDRDAPATMRQKNLVLTLYQRRKLPEPDLKNLTKGQASQLISNMLNDKYFDRG